MRCQQPSTRSASDQGKDSHWHAGPKTSAPRDLASLGSAPTAVAADIGLPKAKSSLGAGARNSPDQHPDLPPGVDSMVREEVHRLQSRVDVLEQVRLCWVWLSLLSRPHSLRGCGSKP